MDEELEFAKQLYSDLIPYDDPEYEQKLQQYAEAYEEALNNISQEDINKIIYPCDNSEYESKLDIPW